MRKILNGHIKFAATLFCIAQSGIATADDRSAVAETKLISGGLSASQVWDSNFFQNPEEVSEQIRLLSANLGLAANISRQEFVARWRVRSYQHAEYDQFDETLQDGLARWNGAWGGDFTTNLEWARDSYLIDRLDTNANESDTVSKDDAKFVLTHGKENRFSFQVGARQTKQTHTSDIRTDLNFDENEAFAGVTYKTPSNSTLTLRYRSGDRTYAGVSDVGNFDFDFRQVEVEHIWKISEKTTSSLTLSRVSRDGAINNSVGDSALLDLSWEATPKVKWHLGYSYKIPALGETIDLPSKVQSGFISLSWEISPKVSLTSRVEKVLRNYDNTYELNQTEPQFQYRTESQYNVIPLSLSYAINNSFSMKLDTVWRKNESPILDRQYTSAQTMLGLAFRF